MREKDVGFGCFVVIVVIAVAVLGDFYFFFSLFVVLLVGQSVKLLSKILHVLYYICFSDKKLF